jgi:zinc protease
MNAPYISTDFSISLEPATVEPLTNGKQLYTLFSSQLEVFKLELIYPFGLLSLNSLEEGHFLPRLMLLGTKQKTAYEIAESLEMLGGFLDIQMGYQRTSVTLHGLSQYFGQYLPLLQEIILEPTFPASEADVLQQAALQNIQVERKKTSFSANKHFKSIIYSHHPILGRVAENFDQIKKLEQIHASLFLKYGCDLFLTGNFSATDLNTLRDFYKHLPVEQCKNYDTYPNPGSPVQVHIPIEDSIQSSIIIGKRLFNRKHPDFIPFMVANTLYGGYFGSRLMKNIREEKGLTYGISSSLSPNGPDGIWSIRAEVNKEKTEEAVIAIQNEMDILKANAPKNDELQMVKNYLLGNILSGTNTLFDIMDKHKAIKYEELPTDFYSNMNKNIQAVDEAQVVEIINKYFNDYSTVIAG